MLRQEYQALSEHKIYDTSGSTPAISQTAPVAWLKYNYLTGGRSILWLKEQPFLFAAELDERREDERHIPPFIHDWRAAELAADFAGQVVRRCLGGRPVEGETGGSVVEGHVGLVKDGCPLEWCAWDLS